MGKGLELQERPDDQTYPGASLPVDTRRRHKADFCSTDNLQEEVWRGVQCGLGCYCRAGSGSIENSVRIDG
jgi:hypothetical protein